VMGVRASVVVCVTSFLLGQFIFTTSAVVVMLTLPSGSLFTHWIADSLTLWKSPVTDEHLWTAALYYSILTRGPVQILYALFAITILGGTTIFWSFNDLEAGNLMFDGGSICTCLPKSSIKVYYSSPLPSPLWCYRRHVRVLRHSQLVVRRVVIGYETKEIHSRSHG
jgi:hypothetical protein